ncbi:hypothetical protein chiPu_0016681 [Chiloscyllium punctatum]|uniref:Uncharacterized protein n=1 Tax=Chiloscyllium punctatum TaxID=137246 RepID=A0A401T689_CHIPU|nr:hypothetical protein [Chiloscyllium punctatum]
MSEDGRLCTICMIFGKDLQMGNSIQVLHRDLQSQSISSVVHHWVSLAFEWHQKYAFANEKLKPHSV